MRWYVSFKDLTNSRIDRQNILNNELAVAEIQEKSGIGNLKFGATLTIGEFILPSKLHNYVCKRIYCECAAKIQKIRENKYFMGC